MLKSQKWILYVFREKERDRYILIFPDWLFSPYFFSDWSTNYLKDYA